VDANVFQTYEEFCQVLIRPNAHLR